MTGNRTAVFRADAAPEIGSGHIMRCLTLADQLKNRGWRCVFACTEETLQTVPALAAAGYAVVAHDSELSGDVLIVDHYGLDAKWEKARRARFKKIMVIDDLADRRHDCDLLLDQTYGRDAEEYGVLSPPFCRVLTGCHYALLRPQFAQRRHESLKRRHENKHALSRLLVSMGSTDPQNVTQGALETLASFPHALTVDVVTGAAAPPVKPPGGPHVYNFYTGVSDMAALMAQADLAIGAGGTTSWERCCMGLPSIIIEIAANQAMIAHALHRAGAAIYAGTPESGGFEGMARALADLRAHPERLKSMGDKAAALCDGEGSGRVAAMIEEMVKE